MTPVPYHRYPQPRNSGGIFDPGGPPAKSTELPPEVMATHFVKFAVPKFRSGELGDRNIMNMALAPIPLVSAVGAFVFAVIVKPVFALVMIAVTESFLGAIERAKVKSVKMNLV
ncbi:hypothetical protein OCU04_010102 [Sclerotinia nivalis]|uniref:Uncharacterized protein n=1 Tax=Sclerotinia nivalis TaxID=352851 RepID=A0A9X0DHJ1_9HELO|nr:hypothetical protein OCU04_010102 [Sclerotinia nivalis]